METYTENLGGMTDYNIFVPENVTADTPVLFYTINLCFTDEMREEILAQNGDAIIIVPQNSPVHVGGEDYGHEFQSEAIEVFELVKDRYNLQTDQFAQAGFSSSYGCSIRTMADYIKNNPDAERQVLISVDGCESDTPQGFPIYDSEYAALKDNNTIIISYAQKYRQNHEVRFLKDSELPILFVVDPEIPEDSRKQWGHYHGVVANNFTGKGLYDSLYNFALGNGELPEGYIYQVYDPKTGEIRDIERSEVADFFGINTYENKITNLKNLTDIVVATDNKTLANHLNSVIGKIKSTSFVQGQYNCNSGYGSTTKVPSKIPSVVSSYFGATANLLTKIADEMQEFSKLDIILQELDKNMAADANQLSDNLVTMNPNIPTTTNLNDGGTNQETVQTEDIQDQPTDGNDNVTAPTDQEENLSTTPESPSTEPESNQEFLNYNQLQSNESTVVYNYNGEYKVVIHKEGDKIVGVEHYYDLGSESNANSNINALSSSYNQSNITNISQNGQYVKVELNEEAYKNLDLNNIVETYISLSEGTKK